MDSGGAFPWGELDWSYTQKHYHARDLFRIIISLIKEYFLLVTWNGPAQNIWYGDEDMLLF